MQKALFHRSAVKMPDVEQAQTASPIMHYNTLFNCLPGLLTNSASSLSPALIRSRFCGIEAGQKMCVNPDRFHFL